MTPEASRILEVFRERGLRSGATLHPTDFGDAIVWMDGYVKDENVRQALSELFDGGFLIEYPNAFELTQKGETAIYGGRGQCPSVGPLGPYGYWACVLEEGHDDLHSSAADVQWSTEEELARVRGHD